MQGEGSLSDWLSGLPIPAIGLGTLLVMFAAAPAGRAAIVLSITVIADINRPMSGGARDSEEAMGMLVRSLHAQRPQVFDRFLASGSAAADRRR